MLDFINIDKLIWSPLSYFCLAAPANGYLLAITATSWFATTEKYTTKLALKPHIVCTTWLLIPIYKAESYWFFLVVH